MHRQTVSLAMVLRHLFLCICLGIGMLAGNSGYGEDSSLLIRSQLDLQELLRYWQWITLPQEEFVLKDAGVYLFAPDSAGSELFFGALLADPSIPDASVVYVSDDWLTGHTLFSDLLGDVVSSLPPEEGEFVGNDGLTLRVSLIPLWPFFGWGSGDITTDETDTANTNTTPAGSAPLSPANSTVQTHTGNIQDALSPSDSLVATNAPTAVVVPTLPEHRIIYVYQKGGNDGWNGKAAFARSSSEGPKKSLRGGLNAVGSRGRLIIKEGDYTEGLNLKGKDIRIVIDGNVSLAQNSPTRRGQDTSSLSAVNASKTFALTNTLETISQ